MPSLRASQRVLEASSGHLCRAGHRRRHQLKLLPVEGEETIGKCFVIYTLRGSEAGWVHAGSEEMRREAVKRCLVFPLCHAQLLHPVLLAACTRLCQPSWQESSEHFELQQIHLHHMPGCRIRAVVWGGHHSP